MDDGWIKATHEGETLMLRAGGRWQVRSAAALDRSLVALDARGVSRVHIDFTEIAALDTVGAWLVLRLHGRLTGAGAEVSIDNLSADFAPLLRQVEEHGLTGSLPKPHRHEGFVDRIADLGRWAVHHLNDAINLLDFLGLVVVATGSVLVRPRRLRLKALVTHIHRTGVSALPIVGLLSFLVGIVFAYQGADQLRAFGAQILTVNVLGITFLRELGVLLTAIICSGRSGSAFTAEIGTMQVNEEIDAMMTLGLDPIEVLVLPRLFALILTLPLLAFFANMMGLLGGALMCYFALDIPLPAFLNQLHGAITGWTFWLGVVKAPFFAVVIALIGCRDGLRVSRSAESVGRLTTLSVVESIFLVIVIDAAFSILFSQYGI